MQGGGWWVKDGEQRVFSFQVWGPVLRTFSAVLEGVEGRVEEWRVGLPPGSGHALDA